MLRRVAPGKTEPLAHIGAGGQAIEAATGYRNRRSRGGQGRGDRQAAGRKGSQSQEGTSVHEAWLGCNYGLDIAV